MAGVASAAVVYGPQRRDCPAMRGERKNDTGDIAYPTKARRHRRVRRVYHIARRCGRVAAARTAPCQPNRHAVSR